MLLNSSHPALLIFAFAVVQVIFGVFIVASSFSAFILTPSTSVVHSASPYWAGFSGLLCGGIGIIAWKHLSTITTGFYALLSALCVILHILAAVLTNRMVNHLQQNSAKCPCICCNNSCKSNSTQASYHTPGCSTDAQTLMSLMVMLCAENIAACIICAFSSLTSLVLITTKKSNMGRVHHRSECVHSMSSPWCMVHECQQLLPPPYHPPPYSANTQPPYVQGPFLLFDQPGVDFAWDTDSLPPPYSSTDILQISHRHEMPLNEHLTSSLLTCMPESSVICCCEQSALRKLATIRTPRAYLLRRCLSLDTFKPRLRAAASLKKLSVSARCLRNKSLTDIASSSATKLNKSNQSLTENKPLRPLFGSRNGIIFQNFSSELSESKITEENEDVGNEEATQPNSIDDCESVQLFDNDQCVSTTQTTTVDIHVDKPPLNVPNILLTPSIDKVSRTSVSKLVKGDRMPCSRPAGIALVRKRRRRRRSKRNSDEEDLISLPCSTLERDNDVFHSRVSTDALVYQNRLFLPRRYRALSADAFICNFNRRQNHSMYGSLIQLLNQSETSNVFDSLQDVKESLV